jgi:hypothetical protein
MFGDNWDRFAFLPHWSLIQFFIIFIVAIMNPWHLFLQRSCTIVKPFPPLGGGF